MKAKFVYEILKEVETQNQLDERLWHDVTTLFRSNAEKFENLDSEDYEEIEKLFNRVFKDAFNGRFGNIRRSWAENMSPKEKYNILKQGYNKDRLRMPDFIQNGKYGYVYKQLNLENPFSGGGTGGKFVYGGATGGNL